MDDALLELVGSAAKRGNKYIKGEVTISELPEKMAELGVLLLETADKLSGLEGESLREELIEVQKKVDDLRLSIFAHKFKR
jgi:hypothetical protein